MLQFGIIPSMVTRVGVISSAKMVLPSSANVISPASNAAS
jgi:hypothetical protein